jgi:hypothetical protein
MTTVPIPKLCLIFLVKIATVVIELFVKVGIITTHISLYQNWFLLFPSYPTVFFCKTWMISHLKQAITEANLGFQKKR